MTRRSVAEVVSGVDEFGSGRYTEAGTRLPGDSKVRFAEPDQQIREGYSSPCTELGSRIPSRDNADIHAGSRVAKFLCVLKRLGDGPEMTPGA